MPPTFHVITVGMPGPAGEDGTDGTDGVGVPIGGATGQVLAKASNTDFDTEWVDQTGGGGGVTDHGALTGLADNDHPQYLLVTDIDDAPVDGELAQPISSNWAFDHLAAADPHPGYLTPVEGDAAYDALGAAAAAVAAHEAALDPHPQYLTLAEGNAAYDALGAAAAAVAAHEAAGDPHPQYLTLAEGNAAFIDSAELAAAIAAHEAAPDPHPQYTTAAELAAAIAAIDHGALLGLGDNDHPQYLLVADIDDVPVNGELAQPISSNWAFDHLAAADPHPGYTTAAELAAAIAAIDHGALTGLADNDHPQYLLVADIDDVPVNGVVNAPISSNWAFDHEAAADPHPGYVTTAELATALTIPDERIVFGSGTGIQSVAGFLWRQTSANTLKIGDNNANLEPLERSVSGTGWQFTINAGDAQDGAGGTMRLQGGTAASTGNGGPVLITATPGVGGNSGGGAVTTTAGNAVGSGTGGAITVTAGSGGGTGSAGAVTITGGAGGSTSGGGGQVTVQGGASTDGNGGSLSLFGRSATGTNRSGGHVDITCGNATQAGTGGSITANAGSAGATGTAGAVSITAGSGGSTSGNGGSATFQGGAGGTAGNGGTAIVQGGLPTNGNGGNVDISGRNAVGTNRDGGSTTILGGIATQAGVGGSIAMTAGRGGATGTAGTITISGGAGGSTSGAGGAVTVQGGTATSGQGGAATLAGRAGVGTNQNGGAANVTAGAATGNGTGGAVNITAGTSPSGTAGAVVVTTGGSERERITGTGKHLIGHNTSVVMVSAIEPNLQMHGADFAGAGASFSQWAADANGPINFFTKSRNAVKGSHTVVQSNDLLGALNFYGSDGDEFLNAGYIQCFVDGTPGNGDMPGRLSFGTTADGAAAATERMRINNSGQVLLGTTVSIPLSGTTNPHLVIAGDATSAYVNIVGYDNSVPALILGSNRNASIGSHTIAQTDDALGFIIANASDGDQWIQTSYVMFQVSGAVADNVVHASINLIGSASGQLNFLPDGQTLVNCVTHDVNTLWLKNSSGSTPYGQRISFTNVTNDNNTQYFFYCDEQTQPRFIIYSDGDAQNHDNSYGAISDERLKQDIRDATSQWDDIKRLRLRKYKFITDVAAKGDAAVEHLGVIAQEVMPISPGLVTHGVNPDTKEETLGVQYSILYLKAVGALQEAMARIEALEAKLAAAGIT